MLYTTVYKLCCTLYSFKTVLYTVHFTNCAVDCPINKLWFTLYSLQTAVNYSLQTVQYKTIFKLSYTTVYKLWCTKYSLKTVLYTVRVTNVLCTTVYKLCCTLYSLQTAVHYGLQTVPYAVQFTNCAVHYGLQSTEHWTIYKLCCTLYGLLNCAVLCTVNKLCHSLYS